MITKFASFWAGLGPQISQYAKSPLTAGFAAFDYGTGGASIPQAIGGSVGGAAGAATGMHLVNKLMSKVPAKGKLGVLRTVASLVGGGVLGDKGYKIGRRVGEEVPGFNHQPLINQ